MEDALVNHLIYLALQGVAAHVWIKIQFVYIWIWGNGCLISFDHVTKIWQYLPNDYIYTL